MRSERIKERKRKIKDRGREGKMNDSGNEGRKAMEEMKTWEEEERRHDAPRRES